LDEGVQVYITARINFVFLFEILNLPALRAKDYSYITANFAIFFSKYLCKNITYKMKMFKETKIKSYGFFIANNRDINARF